MKINQIFISCVICDMFSGILVSSLHNIFISKIWAPLGNKFRTLKKKDNHIMCATLNTLLSFPHSSRSVVHPPYPFIHQSVFQSHWWHIITGFLTGSNKEGLGFFEPFITSWFLFLQVPHHHCEPRGVFCHFAFFLSSTLHIFNFINSQIYFG